MVAKRGVYSLTPKDSSYPGNLLQIDTPPPKLYVKGNITKSDSAAISIVGSRECSDYGRRVAYRFAYELAKAKIVIVSGLARGVDSVAHSAALDAGGRTFAVLGSGINIIYPPEHLSLAEEIVNHGAIVSEFELDEPPRGENFLQRNRLISGLSLGLVVIEGRARSGTLSTATWAANQGREVFAVPGPIDSSLSVLPNYLIENGANIVISPAQIIDFVKSST